MHALKLSLAVAFVAGSVVAMSGAARADVACNNVGECWNTGERYEYPPGVRVEIHPNTWREAHEHDAHFRWLENHEGRGYYEHGEWHPF